MPGMGSMLGTCWGRMAEALEGTVDVPWNGDVNSVVGIVPINGEATVAVTGPIFADDIKFFKCVHEMVGIGFVSEHDAEIVDDEAEDEVGGIMFPQARSNGDRGIAMWRKEFGEAVISNAASLGKAVHPFADLDVDVVMMDERCKLVFCHDRVGDDGDGDAHVLVLLHGRVEIEILEVGSRETGIGCGDHAIEEYLDGSEIGGLGADIAIVLDAVAADGEADMARVFSGRRAATIRR